MSGADRLIDQIAARALAGVAHSAAAARAAEAELAGLLRQVEQRRRRQLARLLPSLQAAAEPVVGAAACAVPGSGAGGLRRIGDELVILRLPKPAGFDYRAGQSAKLELGGVRRRYSFASAPFEPWLEFFIELRPGGRMAEELRRFTPETPVTVAGVKGDLALAANVRNHLMVATVTGISPFRSLLREHWQRQADAARFIVLHGASYQDEFGYAEELRALAAEHPDRLLYVPTVSRPDEARNAGWQGATGRVESLVAPMLEELGLGPGDTQLYACGHPEMVAAVARDYGARGFRVATEPY